MQVAVSELGLRYGSNPYLFRGLTFELGGGDIAALVGPSGSGKSSLLEVLSGGRRPSEGALRISGAMRSAWIFQHPEGSPRRTAIDQVMIPYLARGHTVSEAAGYSQADLERFRIGSLADRPLSDLSGGEAQRLMLARAIAFDPQLLLVDEPTAQLDRQSATDVASVLVELRAPDRVVVLASHDGLLLELVGPDKTIDLSCVSRP